jgi:transcriptional regulator NrdR family protein
VEVVVEEEVKEADVEEVLAVVDASVEVESMKEVDKAEVGKDSLAVLVSLPELEADAYSAFASVTLNCCD